ncbi:MAG: ABC transporter permease, partial [Firmicutes bacterium]|nr:ABC transporter permease [Bacillota bacterium]
MQLLLLGPMMLAVMGAQLLTAEYRQKTLKGSLPLPTSLAGVFAAKAVLGCVALGTALLLTAAVILLVPSLMGLPPSGSLTHAVLKDTGILWVTYLSFLHFAMSVGLISRDFVLPLAASAVVLVGGILAMQGGRNGA